MRCILEPLTRRQRLLAAAGLVAKVLLSAAVLYQVQLGPLGRVLLLDEATYFGWARRIASGDWVGHGAFNQDPLYPYLLALLVLAGGGVLAARLLNALLGLGSLLLLFRWVRSHLGNRAALLAGACFLFWGSLLLDEAGVGKESLVLLLCLLALTTYQRATRSGSWLAWLACGVELGLLALTRGNFLVLWPLTMIAITWRHRSRALVFAAGTLLALAPVAARNLAAGEGPNPFTASSGFLLYVGNHPGASGAYEREPFVTRALVYETDDYRQEAERRVGQPLTPRQASRYWTSQAIGFWRAHPGEALALFGRKIRLAFSARELPNDASLECMRSLFVPALGSAPLGFGWLWPLALAGLLWWWREGQPGRSLLLTSLAYLGTLVLTLVVERYRMPLAPVAAAGTGYFVDRALALAGGRSWRSFALLFAPVAPAAVLVFWPVAGLLTADEELSQCTRLVGSALTDAGRLDEAVPLLQLSMEKAPADEGPVFNLGVALYRAGDLAGAERTYRRALELAPGDGKAYYDLALVLLKKADGAAALEALRAARDAGLPEDQLVGPRGAALARVGSLDAAERDLLAASHVHPDAAVWSELIAVQARLAHCDALDATLESAATAGVRLARPACAR